MHQHFFFSVPQANKLGTIDFQALLLIVDAVYIKTSVYLTLTETTEVKKKKKDHFSWILQGKDKRQKKDEKKKTKKKKEKQRKKDD